MEPHAHAKLVQDTAVEITWPAPDRLPIVRVHGEPATTGTYAIAFP